eukprot:3206522-Pleurochrysis_carterae.AAC.1
MLRVACPGVVWSLALLSQPQSSAKLAYGGNKLALSHMRKVLFRENPFFVSKATFGNGRSSRKV